MKKVILSIALAATMAMSTTTAIAADVEQGATFEGRVIGLMSCNAKKNVILSLYNEELDLTKTFVTTGSKNGGLNPILAKAYISVGKKDKPSITVTFDPEYTGENCGAEIEGEWTGYAK